MRTVLSVLKISKDSLIRECIKIKRISILQKVLIIADILLMRVEIDIDEKYTGLSVEIKAPKITQDIEKMISLMRMINMQMAVKKRTKLYEIDLRLYRDIRL